MNVTLNTYINRAEEIVKFHSKGDIQVKKNLNEFKHMIAVLQETLQKVTDQYEKYNSLSIENKSHILLEHDKYKNKEYENKACILKEQSKYNNYENILTNSCKVIDTHTFIQNKVNLSFIPDLNQFSIKINNLTLRGNLGNIYDKKMLRNPRIQANQVIICANGNNCNNILSKQYCKFYHDPYDLIKLKNNKIITESFYKDTIKYTRNFSNTSWIYSEGYYPNSNYRCIGSKSSIYNDILLCKTSNNYKLQVDNIKAQVMHDLLFLLVLSEQGMA